MAEKLEIRVTQKGAEKVDKDFDKLGKTTDRLRVSTSGIRRSIGALRNQILLVTFATAGFIAALNKLTKASIDLETVSTATSMQFGKNAEYILQKLNKVSGGTVSNNDLILASNRAMVLGVTTNIDEMAKLLEFSRIRARAMGITTTQAFNDIATGIGRNSPLILDNLGIITKGWAGEAAAAGKAYDVQFVLNKVLEQAATESKKLGELQNNAADKAERFKTAIANLSAAIGDRLVGTVGNVTEPITGAITEWTRVLNLHRTEVDLTSEAYINLGNTAKAEAARARLAEVEHALEMEKQVSIWKDLKQSFKMFYEANIKPSPGDTEIWKNIFDVIAVGGQILEQAFYPEYTDKSKIAELTEEANALKAAIQDIPPFEPLSMPDLPKMTIAFDYTLEGDPDERSYPYFESLGKKGEKYIVDAEFELDFGDSFREAQEAVTKQSLEYKEKIQADIGAANKGIEDEHLKLQNAIYKALADLDEKALKDHLAREQRALEISLARWASFGNTISGLLSTGMKHGFDGMTELFQDMLAQWTAELVASGLLALLSGGKAGGVGAFSSTGIFGFLGLKNGGNITNRDGHPVKAQTGFSGIVPAGYPNDSFPIFVQSGEHVSVTSGGNTRSGFDGVVSAINRLESAIMRKPVANTQIISEASLYRDVQTGSKMSGDLWK